LTTKEGPLPTSMRDPQGDGQKGQRLARTGLPVARLRKRRMKRHGRKGEVGKGEIRDLAGNTGTRGGGGVKLFDGAC